MTQTPEDSVDIDTIVKIQCVAAISAIIGVSICGKNYSLKAKQVRMADISIPVVTLLARESTPEETRISPDAHTLFIEAAKNLVAKNQIFYTALNPVWAFPYLLWENADS